MNQNVHDKLALSQGVAYSLPVFVTYFLVVPTGIILPGIYAKHFGLDLTSVATILLIARLFDAITDPIIGYFSDYYRSRTGSRKPLIITGGVLFVISSYFLFVPPGGVSATYYLTWFLTFYLAWTMIEIPHIAWGGELTSSSQGKIEIYSLRAFFLTLGSSLFFALPLLPIFETSEFSPITLQWSVITAISLMLPLLYICMKIVPDGYAHETQNEDTIQIVLNSIMRNRPLVLFLCAYLVSGIGMGMWMGLMFIFADSYLDIGSSLPLALIIGNIIALVCIPAWRRLASRCEKNTVWSISLILGLLAIACTAFLEPGPSSVVLFIALLCILSGVTSALHILPPSLLSDIVDYGTWKFGSDRGATYFSSYMLIIKVNIGVGGALGLGIAGWYGFDPSEATPSKESLIGLNVAIAYVPACLLMISLIFIFLIPINRHRHGIIRQRLLSLSKRSMASSP